MASARRTLNKKIRIGPDQFRGQLFNRLQVAVVFSLFLHTLILFGFKASVLGDIEIRTATNLLRVNFRLSDNASPRTLVEVIEPSEANSLQDEKNSSPSFERAEMRIQSVPKRISYQKILVPPSPLPVGDNLVTPRVGDVSMAYPEYRSSELNPPPVPISEINPEYPPPPEIREGVVVLRLLINMEGGVDKAIVIRSFPQGAFEESALSAFRDAHFSPGLFLGVPVQSQLDIEVEFMPTNRGAAVSGRGY